MSDGWHSSYLAVRNWKRYQHYGRLARPSWIKMYAHLLGDQDDWGLPIAQRLLWRQLLLLAAYYGNAIPNDAKRIGNEVHLPTRTVRDGVEMFLKMGWLQETRTDRRSRAGSRGKTGWRFVRGTHSGHYIQDPDGRDIPPYAARSASMGRRTT